MDNIGFIGLGKLGLPVAEVLSEQYKVFGFDIKPITHNNITITKSIEEVLNSSNIIFVAVQTPHATEYGGELPNTHLPKSNFDYTILKNTLIEISKHSNPSHTIIIISTVLPGTIRKELKTIIKNGSLIYNPYLIAMGTVKEDFKNPEMIIIGSETGDEKQDEVLNLKSIYTKFTPSTCRYEIGTWEEAESIKIFYNTFISAKIAIVNMIQDVAEKNGNMNVDIVTNALAKSTKRITSPAYMKAGMGDGGPCHPRDNIALSWLASNLDLGYDLFESINISREQQAKNLAKKLIEFKNPVVLLGTHYKPNTTLTDGSYALLVTLIQATNHKLYFNNHPVH
ncbi:MAG: NAD(P)-binding domain-containing protein [Chitinophagales bacterium]